MVDDWYNEHQVNSINDLFNMTSNEILAWQHFFAETTDGHKEKTEDREMIQKCFDLRFSIYDSSKRKYDLCTFYDILTKTHKRINNNPIFFMNSFYRDKMNAIDKLHDGIQPKYIRLAEKSKGSDKDEHNKKLWKVYDYLMEKINLLPEDERIITDSKEWLKVHKVKIKRTVGVSKPKGSTVWHYNITEPGYSDYTWGNDQHSRIEYTRARNDELVRESWWQKKRTKLQLSTKLWGYTKLGIDDISDILRAIPADIVFCKADTQKMAISVDKYIEGVMNRKIHTSVGNYILRDFCEQMGKFNDKREIKLVYYPYPEIINENCFAYNKTKEIYICGRDSDELIGLALALKTDRYLRGIRRSDIHYNDKTIASFDSYGTNSMPKAYQNALPKSVKDFVSNTEFVSRWSRTEHRGCIMMGLVDLEKSIPSKYFNDMARSLTYCDDYKQVQAGIIRIKKLFNTEEVKK